jgi:quinol monooxygenase YgiN
VYYEQEINKTASHISSQIEKGEAGRFIISQPDKDAFKDAFLNSVIAQPDEDGTIRYYYTREINPNDIQADLMAEYLRFKKGNLQDIVAKQVKTEQARTLRKSTQSNNKKTNDRADDIMLSALFKTL